MPRRKVFVLKQSQECFQLKVLFETITLIVNKVMEELLDGKNGPKDGHPIKKKGNVVKSRIFGSLIEGIFFYF